MSPILAGVAFVVTAGAVVSVSARESRLALVGVALALAGAPFLAQPLPPISTLATRVIGAALAAYILRAALAASQLASDGHDRDVVRAGSRLGWPTETLLALAAWIVGVSVSLHLEALNPANPVTASGDLLSALSAPSIATGAGLAAIVLGLVPALGSTSAFRTTAGLLILLQGVLLFRVGVAGPAGDLEQLAGVALVVAAAIAGSVLMSLESRSADEEDRQARPSIDLKADSE